MERTHIILGSLFGVLSECKRWDLGDNLSESKQTASLLSLAKDNKLNKKINESLQIRINK